MHRSHHFLVYSHIIAYFKEYDEALIECLKVYIEHLEVYNEWKKPLNQLIKTLLLINAFVPSEI